MNKLQIVEENQIDLNAFEQLLHEYLTFVFFINT